MKKKKIYKILSLLILFTILFTNFALSKDKKNYVKKINSTEELKKILEKSKDTVIVIDLYADWCGPCRMLAPIIKEVAEDFKKNKKVEVYKVDVDDQTEIAQMFRVRSIPYVVFLKNKELVDALLGVRDKETYVKTIKKHLK